MPHAQLHDVSVHGIAPGHETLLEGSKAHDLGEDGSAEADEGPDDREHWALQEEALNTIHWLLVESGSIRLSMLGHRRPG